MGGANSFECVAQPQRIGYAAFQPIPAIIFVSYPFFLGLVMQQTEDTVIVATNHVACDGGGGVAGHPRVFLTIPASGSIPCPYCGKIFRLSAGAVGRGH